MRWKLDKIFQICRSASVTKIEIRWSEPSVFGDALIAGYKVFINSKLVAQLEPDQLSFEFTKGLMCREYCFQVQALSSLENLDSELSKPLVVLWPGVVPPELECLPATRQNSIRVGWHPPFIAGNVKLIGYRVRLSDVQYFSFESDDGFFAFLGWKLFWVGLEVGRNGGC